MREQAFRAHLGIVLSENSTRSYLSNLRWVEGMLGVDLDTVDLSAPGVDAIGLGLGMLPAEMRRSAAHRSNCLSAVRSYAAFRSGGGQPSPTARSRPARPPRPALPPRSVSAEVAARPARELLALLGEIGDELRQRRIVRTGNAPLGDYAETLCEQALGWQLAAPPVSGHDAVGGGLRYQIKARRIGSGPGWRQLSILRRLDQAPFDMLAAVLFTPGFDVERALLIPYRLVFERAAFVAHVNGWRFMLDDGLWAEPGVRDVTTALRLAQPAVDARR